CFVWNPRLGELRLETNAVIFFNAINALWNYCRTFEEATAGLQPIVEFVGRRERFIKKVGKMFYAPVIELLDWVPRDKVPPFALREPTVKPPAALDNQVKFALLEARPADREPAP